MEWTNSYSLEQTGAFVKSTRKKKGFTQDEFAEIIGTSHATLSSLENGKNVSTKVLEKALNYLGLKMVIVPKAAQVEITKESFFDTMKESNE